MRNPFLYDRELHLKNKSNRIFYTGPILSNQKGAMLLALMYESELRHHCRHLTLKADDIARAFDQETDNFDLADVYFRLRDALESLKNCAFRREGLTSFEESDAYECRYFGIFSDVKLIEENLAVELTFDSAWLEVFDQDNTEIFVHTVVDKRKIDLPPMLGQLLLCTTPETSFKFDGLGETYMNEVLVDKPNYWVAYSGPGLSEDDLKFFKVLVDLTKKEDCPYITVSHKDLLEKLEMVLSPETQTKLSESLFCLTGSHLCAKCDGKVWFLPFFEQFIEDAGSESIRVGVNEITAFMLTDQSDKKQPCLEELIIDCVPRL